MTSARAAVRQSRGLGSPRQMALALSMAALLPTAFSASREGSTVSEPLLSAQYIPLNPREMLVFLEAENFTVPEGSRWEPREWAKSPNYFASTVANVFHSRRAHLHHPALADAGGADRGTTAAAAFVVPAAGEYSVLIRYEAPYRFEIPFEVNITQNGRRFSRTYGRRATPKVWGFQSGRHAGVCFETYRSLLIHIPAH